MSGHDTLSGVYAIIHQPSGRAYVGSSCDVFRRWRAHASMLNSGRHSATQLLEAWLMDGPGAFTFVLLESCPRHILQDREQEWLDSFEEPLNTSANASCPSLDPVVAAKIGAAHKGRKNPGVAERNRLRKGLKHLYPMSQEAREKLSAARRGRIFGPRAPSVGEKIAAALRGRPLTEERKAKISAAMLAKPKTEKQLAHLEKLHAGLRTKHRYVLRDLMAQPERRAQHIANHWAKSPRAVEIGRRISASKIAKRVNMEAPN